ncbi:conserved phage C-terminal domain-containing protein [Lacrimispora sp.]|uniref:conserved phage C-terminal domain-containing protein n=1 Tax=Lacrimispora sp. TaxID=2719234 RepID=UPI00289EC385|nr:conserved phage C-terminal domain-containing protein [Lacrimispora sp.]
MGEGGKDKVSGPQLEDGYTRVANELLEAVFHADFNGAQIRILLCLIRNTYGYGRKECEFSNSFVAKGTGLNKKSVALVMNSLQEGKVITVTQQPTYTSPKKVKLNKCIKEWSPLPPQWKTSPTGADVTSGTGEDVTSGTGEDVTPQKRKILKKDIKEIVEKPPYQEIIDYLNSKTGKSYRWQTKATQGHINARFADGYTMEDFKNVIDKKTAEWKGGEMEQYLRPETLFGSKFEGYLNQSQGKEKKENGPLGRRTGTNEKGLAAEAISAGIDTDCTGIFDGY